MKLFNILLLILLVNFSCQSVKTAKLKNYFTSPSKDEMSLFTQEESSLISLRSKEINNTLDKQDNDVKTWLRAFDILLMQNRVTGNHVYAENIYQVTKALLKNNKLADDLRFQLMSYETIALLSLHEFQEALMLATEASKLAPQNAAILGAMIDANVELGNYEAAVKLTDRMVGLRPDLRSYSRVSYLREIYGDVDGAIEAMKEAVLSGVPGDEQCEWSRVQLSKLYMQKNAFDYAKMHLTLALDNRNNYLPAMDGLANLFLIQKQIASADSTIDAALKMRSAPYLLATKIKIAIAKNDKATQDKYYALLMNSLAQHGNFSPTENSPYLVKSKLKEKQYDHEMKQIALEKAKYIIDLGDDTAQALPYLEFENNLRPKNKEVIKYMAMVNQMEPLALKQ